MKKNKLLCGVLLSCACITTHAADENKNPDIGNWEDVTIAVGNEKGTSGNINGRMRYYTSTRFDNMVLVPYIVYIPEQGRIMMLFNAGSPHFALTMYSDDNGETWSLPQPPGNPAWQEPEVGAVPFTLSLANLGKGRLSARLSSAQARLVSSDNGETWKQVPEQPSSKYGKIYNWDPELAATTPAGERIFATGYYLDEARNNYGVLRHSDDGGVTWSEWRAIPEWAGANEIALAQGSDGLLIAACRVEAAEVENDHFSSLEYSISNDSGETWSARQPIQGLGRMHPSMATRPSDGLMVMSYVVRKGYPNTPEGKPQYGIEAVVSCDGGRTWDTENRYLLARMTGPTHVKHHITGEMLAYDPIFFAVQATSTIWLPERKKFLTVFSTTHRATTAQKSLTPREIGFIEWEPLD